MFFYNGKEFSNLKSEQKEDIIEGICPVGLTLLFGPEKVGKSLLTRSLIVSLCNDSTHFLQYPILRKGNIVYFALDDSENTLHARFDCFSKFDNYYIVTSRTFLECQKYGGQYSKIGYIFSIIDSIINKKGPVTLVVVDTLEKVRNSYSKRDYAHEVEDLNILKCKAEEIGANFLLVHHATKSNNIDPLQNYYGSKGLGAEVDVLISITNTSDQNVQSLQITGNNIQKKEILISRNAELEYSIENMNREDLLQNIPEKALIQLVKYFTKKAQLSINGKYKWKGQYADLITEADLDIAPKSVGKLLQNNEKQLSECHISFKISRKNYGLVVEIIVDRSGERS